MLQRFYDDPDPISVETVDVEGQEQENFYLNEKSDLSTNANNGLVFNKINTNLSAF